MNNWIKIIVWVAVIGIAFGFMWKQGVIARIRLYIQETREEFKKCSWPSWEELKGSTALIIVSIVLLGVFTFVVDFAMNVVFVKLNL
mgnify:FL=1